jgi:hypothetical protein
MTWTGRVLGGLADRELTNNGLDQAADFSLVGATLGGWSVSVSPESMTVSAEDPLPAVASLAWKRSGVRVPSVHQHDRGRPFEGIGPVNARYRHRG